MNRQARRAIERLPTSASAWEVAFVDVPIVIQGVDTEGLLVIAEARTGNARGAGPIVRGEGLWEVLGRAFTAPPSPCVPARPPRILCADAGLAARIESELRGTGVKVERVAEVPAAAALIESVSAHFRPVSAPGIKVELGAWAMALEQLCRDEPWEELSDAVRFRFDAAVPDLADAVAIVLGRAGEQRGIALFPSAAMHEAFRAAEGPESAVHADVECLNLYLDPSGDLAPAEEAACRAAGFALPGGLFPRLIGIRAGRGYAPDAHEQRVLLSAVQAIAALCREATDDLEQVATSREVRTCLGRLTIRSIPAAPDVELLVRGAHTVVVTQMKSLRDGVERPAIVLKVGKRQAVRLARVVAEVDALRFEPDGDGHIARVSAGGRELGALFRFDASASASVRMVAQETTVLLGISAGGGRRSRLDEDHLELISEVRIGGPAEGPVRHDAVFDRPMAGWPSASGTLLDFAGTAVSGPIGALATDTLQTMLEFASNVWNAVIIADFLGNPDVLEEVRDAVRSRGGLPIEFIDGLVRAKRTRWRRDPRIFGQIRVKRNGREATVDVATTILPGYRVGGWTEDRRDPA